MTRVICYLNWSKYVLWDGLQSTLTLSGTTQDTWLHCQWNTFYTRYRWMRSGLTPTFLRALTAASQGRKPLLHGISPSLSLSLSPNPEPPFFSLRWNSVQGERVLYVVPAAQSAFDPGPMGRKHVQRTICNGKTNPVKKDFAEWGNGLQLSCVFSDRCFLSCLLVKPAPSPESTSGLWRYKQGHYSIC